MHYHDYHLRGYTVSEFGKRIVLDLVFDYAGLPKAESRIEFTGVAAHQFTLGMGAIIVEIVEEPIAAFVESQRPLLAQIANEIGLAHWVAPGDDYAQRLEDAGLRVWNIESAIGFSGFVIAKDVGQVA